MGTGKLLKNQGLPPPKRENGLSDKPLLGFEEKRVNMMANMIRERKRYKILTGKVLTKVSFYP